MNVLITDSDSWSVMGVARLIYGGEVIGQHTKNLASTHLLLQKNHFDYMITELVLSENSLHDVYQFLKGIRFFQPSIKIIILTWISDVAVIKFIYQHLTDVIILLKDDPVREIESAIWSFHEYKVINRIRWCIDTNLVMPLNKVEFGMMKWIAEGNKQVVMAKYYNLSCKTISNYKVNLLKKLSCNTMADLQVKLKDFGYLKI